MEWLQPASRVDGSAENSFRRACRHLLDIHAALGRGHNGDAAGSAVEQHTKIELARNITAFLDIDALDFFSFWPGLMGNQRHADHRLGGLDHLVDRLGNLYAAALAPPTGMNLCLDHPYGAAQRLRGFFSLLRRIGDLATRDSHAILSEQCLRLIFMDIHEALSLSTAAAMVSNPSSECITLAVLAKAFPAIV